MSRRHREIKNMDFVGVAGTLLKTLRNRYPHIAMTHVNETEVDVAKVLEQYIKPDLITELIDSFVGQGILIGMVTTLYHTFEVGKDTGEADGGIWVTIVEGIENDASEERAQEEEDGAFEVPEEEEEPGDGEGHSGGKPQTH